MGNEDAPLEKEIPKEKQEALALGAGQYSPRGRGDVQDGGIDAWSSYHNADIHPSSWHNWPRMSVHSPCSLSNLD